MLNLILEFAFGQNSLTPEYLDPFNAAAHSFIAHAQAFFSQEIADPVAARQLGLQELENLRQQQASSLAYFDCFWMFAVLTFALVFAALCERLGVPASRPISRAPKRWRGRS